MNLQFCKSTHCIPQPYGCFLYDIRNSRYDVYNHFGYLTIRHIYEYEDYEDFINLLCKKYKKINCNDIRHDVEKLILDFKKKKYLTNNVLADKKFEEFSDKRDFLKMLRAEIEITQACNLNCSYCYAKSTVKSKNLNKKQWKNLIDNLYIHGTRCLIFSGGEPFIYPRFLELLEWSNNKFIIEINSNGTLINSEIINRLKKINLKVIQVSLDSSTPENHDKYRGKGTWKKTMESIGELRRNHIPVRICMTVHRDNAHEIEEVKKIAHHFKAEFFPDSIKKVGRAHDLKNKLWNFSRNGIFRETFHLADTFDVDCQSKIGFAAISHNGHLKPCNLSLEYFYNINKKLISEYSSEWYKKWYQEIPAIKKFILSSKIEETIEKNSYFHNCFLKNGLDL